MRDAIKVFLLCGLAAQVLGFPQSSTVPHQSYVVTSTEPSAKQEDSGLKEGASDGPPSDVPKIYELRVDANVSNRFTQTLVTSRVVNAGNKAQEAFFSVILPEKAFISKFVMVIDGKNYEAYVKEKEEAKQIYEQAVASGLGAGHVATNARDSNRFTVSVNVEPKSKAVFLLTYEELLERQDGQYELVINIHPKQPVKNLFVNVNINETLPLAFVRAPPIRSGNEISDSEHDLDPRADVKIINSTSAVVLFSPNIERQKQLAKSLGTEEKEGLSGQFIVQYDVERNPSGGEILLQDGYFVHFFAPSDLPSLPKHVLFVLDTSGSMYGTKIEQLKTAMRSILADLKPHDLFHLIDFNTYVSVLNIFNSTASVRFPDAEPSFFYTDTIPKEDISAKEYPSASKVDPDSIKQATQIVNKMEANGGTNIYDALRMALHLVSVEKKKSSNSPQPLIIFLTDGDATVGITDSQKIISDISELNLHSVPIFSLSFGFGADRSLLQKLSLRNNGFSRHIYEAADASLQLQDFYRHISSPLLSNVTFKYIDEAKELTKTVFPILFGGSELVVAGILDKEFPQLPKVSGWGIHGPIDLVPEIKKPITSLERLWAYLTVRQLLDESEVAANKTAYEKRALALALKYSFVTPVSSLVVVKPNSTDSSIQPEAADKGFGGSYDVNRIVGGMAPSLAYNSPVAFSGPVAFAGHFSAGGAYPSVPSYAISSNADRFDTSLVEEDVESVTASVFTPLDTLKLNIPWLDSTLSNDIIHTPTGDYKLGLNETTPTNTTCPTSPLNGTGYCKLLHECPEVHHLLSNVHIFLQYICDLDGFASVCCPPKKQ